jgi:ubiquinone/menaquinone biosynthesis C-methylase UbiE
MPTQAAVQRWFNRTYAERGLSYLRPSEFYSIFLEYLEARPGQRLLDVGCGPGLLLGEAVRAGAQSWGVDLSQTALGMARRGAPGARVACSNAETLPFRDGWFDGVTCIGTLEHFFSPERALAEMRRVLKPDGRACIMVPSSRALKWWLEAKLLRIHEEDSHERAATLEEWRELLSRGGFTIERIERDEWPRRRPSAWHLVPLRWATQYVFLLRP